MWCISAYVAGEEEMTKIFAVYLQASGFSSQLSEYMLSSVAVNSLGDIVSPCRTLFLVLKLLLSLCWWTVIELLV